MNPLRNEHIYLKWNLQFLLSLGRHRIPKQSEWKESPSVYLNYRRKNREANRLAEDFLDSQVADEQETFQ